MSDIFLSHALKDHETAAKLASVFEQQQWTVWWNPTQIPNGADYTAVMVEELMGAKVVVVVLSGSGGIVLSAYYP